MNKRHDHDPTDEPAETRSLRNLLELTARRATPDLPRLESGALVRGRRLRRRRRAGAALGSLAAAAVAAVALAPAIGGAGPVDRGTDPAPASRPGTTAPTAPSQTTTGSPADGAAGGATSTLAPWSPPPGVWDLGADELAERLPDTLPDGIRITRTELAPPDRAPDSPAVAVGWLRADLAARTGAGALELMLLPPEHPDLPVLASAAQAQTDGEPRYLARVTCPAPGSGTACRQLRDDAGEPVGALTRWVGDGFTVLTAEVLSADGGLVHVSTANSLDSKWGAGYRPLPGRPPLTLGQLGAIAQAPAWSDSEPDQD